MFMSKDQREIQHKLLIMGYAEEIGQVVKACRYFGIGRSSFYRWMEDYAERGEAGLITVLRPGGRWSLDFVSDTFGASPRFRILAVNDYCCREILCLMPDTRISGARVARELDALVRVYGKPACIVSDNGT